MLVPRTDVDVLGVAADHGAEPDADVFFQRDLADHLGAVGDPGVLAEFRGLAVEFVDCHLGFRFLRGLRDCKEDGFPALALAGSAVSAGMCARQRSHFLLLRQEKVTKEKASRIRRPSLRYGHAALLGAAGVWLNSLRSNNASPDPSAPALLASS